MKPFYWITITTLNFLIRLFYRHKVYGVMHIPKGAAILSANHTSFLDPPVIAISCPEEVSYLAKEGLFTNPFLKKLIINLNAYPVTDKGARNLNSFKTVITLLNEGKKVVIFPEGIRS